MCVAPAQDYAASFGQSGLPFRLRKDCVPRPDAKTMHQEQSFQVMGVKGWPRLRTGRKGKVLQGGGRLASGEAKIRRASDGSNRPDALSDVG